MDKDYLVRVLTDKKTMRGLACLTPKLVQEAANSHQTSTIATEALGKALTLAALMGALLKVRQRVAMKWEGEGEMSKVVVEAESNGAVRGYVAVPNAQSGLGKRGYLFVTKDLRLKELYRGVVPLVSGKLDEDLQFYLNQSEQIPSIVGAEVLLAENGEVSMSAGFLVQSLPPYGEEVVELVRGRLERMPALTQWLVDGNSLEKWLETLFADSQLEILDARELAFHCTCSPEKMSQALATLDVEELTGFIAEGQAEVQCQFCRRQYLFNRAELQQILQTRAL